MKIEEALEEMRIYLQKDLVTYTFRRAEAVKLGIEALKAIKCGREGLRTEFQTPLRGETK